MADQNCAHGGARANSKRGGASPTEGIPTAVIIAPMLDPQHPANASVDIQTVSNILTGDGGSQPPSKFSRFPINQSRNTRFRSDEKGKES
jgi:hypothetical protein